MADLPDPEPGPGRGRRSTSPPRPSTAPTCCSGRASTRRRPAPPTCSAWSAAAPSPRSARASPAGRVGDQVCALLAGGGYAEQVAVPAGQLMPVPDGVDLVTAAALPEVACTVWSNVFMVAGLQPGETLLVHGGAGGIGTFAIQLAHAVGARVLTTAGSRREARRCAASSAPRSAIDYREEDFVEVVREVTDGRGCRRHPRQHGRDVPRPQRRRARHRGPARRHRPAGRHQGRARPRRPAAQARRGHRHRRCGPARSRRRRRSAPPSSSTSGRWWPTARYARSCTPRCRWRRSATAHALMEAGRPPRQDPPDRLTRWGRALGWGP